MGRTGREVALRNTPQKAYLSRQESRTENMASKSAPEGLTQRTPVKKGRRSIQKIMRSKAISRAIYRIERLVPWLTEADRPLLRAFAELERLAQECYNLMRSEGMVRADGEPHKLLAHYANLRKTQAILATHLGLSPKARRELRDGAVREIDLPAQFAKLVNAEDEVSNGNSKSKSKR